MYENEVNIPITLCVYLWFEHRSSLEWPDWSIHGIRYREKSYIVRDIPKKKKNIDKSFRYVNSVLFIQNRSKVWKFHIMKNLDIKKIFNKFLNRILYDFKFRF